jgi:hypothetical protein
MTQDRANRLRGQIAFLGADGQVTTCNQISEHSVDEPRQNITAQVGWRLVGNAAKRPWAGNIPARAKYKIRSAQGRQEN